MNGIVLTENWMEEVLNSDMEDDEKKFAMYTIAIALLNPSKRELKISELEMIFITGLSMDKVIAVCSNLKQVKRIHEEFMDRMMLALEEVPDLKA